MLLIVLAKAKARFPTRSPKRNPLRKMRTRMRVKRMETRMETSMQYFHSSPFHLLIRIRYVVEEILKHDWHDNGTLLFQIKWQGYPLAKDFTWEEEENVEKLDALKDYYKKIGGRPDFDAEVDGKGKAKGKGRGKGKGKGKRTFSETAAAATPETKRRGRKKRANGSDSGTPVVDV
jgi:hypothetical protein